jgi:hypothetical protein
MRISKFDENTKKHLIRMITQYEAGKLSPDEEVCLFQDLVDSGFGWQIGPDYLNLINNLIVAKVVNPPQSGFVPPAPKFSELVKVKKVTLH